MKYQLL